MENSDIRPNNVNLSKVYKDKRSDQMNGMFFSYYLAIIQQDLDKYADDACCCHQQYRFINNLNISAKTST